MKLQRLFSMRPAELAFRGRQEVFKAVDRLSEPRSGRTAACRLDHSTVSAAVNALLDERDTGGDSDSAAELQSRFTEAMAGRFYVGAQEASGPAGRRQWFESDPAFDSEQLISYADAVCRHEFPVLGYGNLSFGQPPNWHLDPVSDQESPWAHWSRLNPLAPEQVGDSKVVWELNRHQWALDLAQAYRITGDEKYAKCFIELLKDWMERNPRGWGINWSSALEVAMRMISWCWALCLFRDSPALTPRRLRALVACLQEHADFVERYYSRYFAPNTHLTVEALSLYYVGTLLPELQGARRWVELGRSILLEQLPLQVPEGGVYFEQSTRYQYYTAEIYLHFAILAERNDDPLPELVRERLREMLHFLLEARRPDGTVPQIGDTDGGWLCPLSRREVGDYRGLFSTAALFLNDSQLAWAAETVTIEALFLLGSGVVGDWQALASEPPPTERLNACYPAGYVMMRSGWDQQAHQLIFDTGPLGCHICGGHGHADLLAMQCSAFGENYLVDPGTGCYTTGSSWRQYFRSTRAHSTVLIDDLDQAVTDGPFSWHERPAARLLKFESGPTQVFAAAQHDAYARLEDSVTHQRRIWFLDARLWLVVDDLLGAEEHQVDLRFQFAPLPVGEEADGWVRARGGASSLLLKTFSTHALHTKLLEGASQPTLGWYSPNYGQKTPAPALTIGTHGALPLRLATLIVPARDPVAPPPEVMPCLRDGMLTSLSITDAGFDVPDFGELIPGSTRSDRAPT